MDLQRSVEFFRETQESLESCCTIASENEKFWKQFESRISSAEKYRDWDKIGSGYFVDEIRNQYKLLVGEDQPCHT